MLCIMLTLYILGQCYAHLIVAVQHDCLHDLQFKLLVQLVVSLWYSWLQALDTVNYKPLV